MIKKDFGRASYRQSEAQSNHQDEKYNSDVSRNGNDAYRISISLPNQQLVMISRHEFDLLEKSKPDTSNITFGAIGISVGTAFLISILTNFPESPYIFMGFLSACLVGFTLGFFFIIRYFYQKKRYEDVLEIIRQRLIFP